MNEPEKSIVDVKNKLDEFERVYPRNLELTLTDSRDVSVIPILDDYRNFEARQKKEFMILELDPPYKKQSRRFNTCL